MLQALQRRPSISIGELRGILETAHADYSIVADLPNDEQMQCISESENPDEAGECVLPFASPTQRMAGGGQAKQISGEKRRRMLMGSATSLPECLSTAENRGEVDECIVDYNELVAGSTSANDP